MTTSRHGAENAGRWLVAACIAVAGSVSVAGAVDVALVTKKMVVKDTGRTNRTIFLSKDGAVVVPTGDQAPDVVGMTFELMNPITGESATWELPAENWRSNRSGTTYRYRDRNPTVTHPVKRAIFRNRRILKVVAASTGITLDEPQQGTLGVVIRAGDVRFCALFDPFSVRRDQPCKFVAKRSAAPVSCPRVGVQEN